MIKKEFEEETNKRKKREKRTEEKRIGHVDWDEGTREPDGIEMGEGLLTECGFKEKWGHVFSVKLLGP